MIIGEYAADTDKHQTATKAVHAVAPEKGVGRIIWSFREGTRGDLLCKDGECAVKFDSNDQPTNLTWVGELVWADNYGLNTGVQNCAVTAKDFELVQIYPNPFNSSTTIRFQLPEPSPLQIKVYNSRGQIVRTLYDEKASAGTHTVQWDASNFTSGVYFISIKSEHTEIIKKCLLAE